MSASGKPPNNDGNKSIQQKGACSSFGGCKYNPEELIKKYYEQLTLGCGQPNCPNLQCVSGGFKALPCDQAGAKALQLLIAKAPICQNMFETEKHSIKTVQSVLKPDPVLSYEYIKQLVETCQKENNDYRPLIHIIGQVFSSPDLLNKSFIVAESDIQPNSPESILPLNPKEVLDTYNFLLGLEVGRIENALINAMNALGNSIEIQLKTNKQLEKKDLNQFVIVLLNPNVHSPEYLESALPNILRAMTALPLNLQTILVKYWSKYTPGELNKIADIFQQLITVRILTGPHATTALPINDDNAITNSVKSMKLIYYASIYGGEMAKENVFEAEEENNDEPMESEQLLSNVRMSDEDSEDKQDELEKSLDISLAKCTKPLIPHENFVNECLNDVIEMDRDFMHYKDGGIRFSFLKFPFVLSTATKNLGLFYDNKVRMYSERRFTLIFGMMQGGNIASPYLRLRVRRDHLIADSLVTLEMIAQDRPQDFKKQFFVEFEGEQGIDEGGVSKEFFQLVTEELFNPDFAMFRFNEETRTCWFNHGSFETDSQFTLIGLLFGIAIYNNIILDVHFPPVLYRKLLGLRATLEDLQSSHPQIYKSLKELLDHGGNVAEDIMVTFEISYEDLFGSTVQHELIPNGKDVEVTNRNREEYVARYTDFLLNTSIKRQFQAFKRGFDIVTSDSILKSLFRPDELELLVCGSQVYDINELENATEYDGGYDKDKPVIKYFWQVVHGMSSDQAKQLLNFTTGSDRVPVGGLAKLKLIIAKNGEDSDRLPTSHTCFNVLLLPEYSSVEKLRERLLKAIANAKGFGLM